MRKIYYAVALLSLVVIISCGKKTDQDRAITLVEAKYEKSNKKLDFDSSQLDSLYNISPQAFADSLKKGSELDDTLAVLESQIEHLNQAASDSVGLISAKLTKERYRLLDVAKTKPAFIGWKLSKVIVEGEKAGTLSFNFDKEITKIVP